MMFVGDDDNGPYFAALKTLHLAYVLHACPPKKPGSVAWLKTLFDSSKQPVTA